MLDKMLDNKELTQEELAGTVGFAEASSFHPAVEFSFANEII